MQARSEAFNAVTYLPGGMSRAERELGALVTSRINAAGIAALKAAGLTPLEIFDLINSVAIFAWANRLMLNLGEPVVAPASLTEPAA